MLAPSKWLLSEYKFIVMKMFDDLPINPIATTNYKFYVMWKL
jgi:hypothetical protein